MAVVVAFVTVATDGAGDIPLAEELAGEGRIVTVGPKVAGQMGPRGWSAKTIQEAIESGDQVPAINKATGGPATRYISPTTGQSVVVDNSTGSVIHVGGPGFQYGPGSGDIP